VRDQVSHSYRYEHTEAKRDPFTFAYLVHIDVHFLHTQSREPIFSLFC
jgi:hypothetical protein